MTTQSSKSLPTSPRRGRPPPYSSLTDLPKSKEEALALGLTYYFTREPCRNGHLAARWVPDAKCSKCKSERRKNWARKNKISVLAKQRIWSAKWRADPENRKKWNANALLAMKKYLAKPGKKELNQATKKKYYSSSLGKVRMKESTIRKIMRRRQRLPTWANLEKIEAVYHQCPAGFQVDHIIPLQGKLVSGLHVHNNLQHLPAFENNSKHNRFDPATFVGP